MNILTWRHINPSIGRAGYRGYLGKVQLFYIGTSMTAREHNMYLSSILFPNQRNVFAKGTELLKQAAEDRAQQMLKDMGVQVDEQARA